MKALNGLDRHARDRSSASTSTAMLSTSTRSNTNEALNQRLDSKVLTLHARQASGSTDTSGATGDSGATGALSECLE